MAWLAKLIPDDADRFKLVSSYLVGAVVIVVCLAVIATQGNDRSLTLLVFILGGAVGWILGLAFTPTSEAEKDVVSEYAKAFGALVSGFGLAKIEDLPPTALDLFGSDPYTTALRLLLFVIAVLICAAVHLYLPHVHSRRSG